MRFPRNARPHLEVWQSPPTPSGLLPRPQVPGVGPLSPATLDRDRSLPLHRRSAAHRSRIRHSRASLLGRTTRSYSPARAALLVRPDVPVTVACPSCPPLYDPTHPSSPPGSHLAVPALITTSFSDICCTLLPRWFVSLFPQRLCRSALGPHKNLLLWR
jgi:hypothetical protein